MQLYSGKNNTRFTIFIVYEIMVLVVLTFRPVMNISTL
jgi:hypothetical protein